MGLKVTEAEYVDKHARRLKGAVDDIRRGVEKVSISPGSLAKAKKSKWVDRMTSSDVQDRWERRVDVGLESWKADMLEKGVARVSGGIDRASGKMHDFASWLLPKVDAASGKAKSLPDLTLDDMISRATTYMREMAKNRYK